MKLSKLAGVTLLLFSVLSVENIHADTSTQKNKSQTTLIILKKENSNNHKRRPGAPDRQHVDCSYNDGKITITFVIPEGECTTYIKEINNNRLHSFIFDSSKLIVDIEITNIEDFYIEIRTECGNTYSGTSYFE